jgi:hypothetical protein
MTLTISRYCKVTSRRRQLNPARSLCFFAAGRSAVLQGVPWQCHASKAVITFSSHANSGTPPISASAAGSGYRVRTLCAICTGVPQQRSRLGRIADAPDKVSRGFGVEQIRRSNPAGFRYAAIRCRAVPLISAAPFSAIMIGAVHAAEPARPASSTHSPAACSRR